MEIYMKKTKKILIISFVVLVRGLLAVLLAYFASGFSKPVHDNLPPSAPTPEDNNTACPHDIVTVPGREPSCIEPGVSDAEYCKLCDWQISKARYLPATGHHMNTENSCENCGAKASQGLVFVSSDYLAGKTSDPNEIVDEGYYVIDGIGKCTDTDLILPGWHNGAAVYMIDEGAFYNNPDIQSVELSDSIREIGKQAFYRCEGLKRAVIASGVYSIGEGAFLNCSQLEELQMGAGVTVVGQSAFNNCESLKEVVLPEGLEQIGSGAFRNCASLTEAEIPGSVQQMGEYVFQECAKLEKVVIPEGITLLGSAFFGQCHALTHVELPTTLEEIADSAFAGCESLSALVLPDTVTAIGSYAFGDCTNLSEITLSKELKTIGSSAFRNCTALSGIVIPDGVTAIENNAFDGLLITEIVIPESVTEIGANLFARCEELAAVYCEAKQKPKGWDSEWRNKLTATVYWSNNWSYVDGIPTAKS